MRIILSTVQVPLVRGGAEILAEELKKQLLIYGHQADIVSIPFKWYPPQSLYNSILMGRMMELEESAYQKVDGVIGLKFPAYYAHHPKKVLWLVHQHRQAYDLWGTDFGDLHLSEDGKKLKDFILQSDSYFLNQYKDRYTISKNVADRLSKFNGLSSQALYHPPHDSQKFYCDSFENYIFYPSRIDGMKRQWLLIEAARHLKSDLKIKIAGTGHIDEIERLKKMIRDYGLEGKVQLLGRISDDEKFSLYAKCKAVYFGCYDEDYGYISLEAQLSKKPLLIHPDAGGPVEFIEHGQSGFIVEPKAQSLAQVMDQLSDDSSLAEKMGSHGYNDLLKKNVSWENVIQKLLAGL